MRLAGVVETPGELLLLTELCGGGDLMHHVEGQRKFTAGDAAAYFSDACAAIARCHAVSVARRAGNECFKFASTRAFRARAFRKKHPRVESAPRDDRSSKN